MNRQQVIEMICQIIGDPEVSDDTRTNARKVLGDLTSNRITPDQAYNQINNQSKYWSSIELPKNLYDNVKKFKKGTLSSIQKMKLVSSIVTRCIIEVEFHPDLDVSATGFYEFLDYLNYLSGRSTLSYEEDYLSDLLNKYGFIENKEVI